MSHPSTSRRRWRRTALAAAGVTLIAAVAPMISAAPAGAALAPLVTEDGVGIRLDENAILGPALELIEDELQPFVNTKIQQGAAANSVMDDPDWVTGTATVELSFDFKNAGTTGFTQGGLSVRADLTNILMRFYRYGEWWQPECLIHVVPDPGYIDASAYINTTLLPAAPLTVNPITAYWDETPTATIAPGYSWACNGYLIDEWWDGLWGNTSNVADQLEAELNGQAQDLINDLWADNITPVIDSLTAYGITFGQVRTDDEGLIVTADVDATGGITLPGQTIARDVTNTEDAGITHDVNTVLAQTTREVIATIHPNVAGQFMNALNQGFSNTWGQYPQPVSIENLLIPATVHGSYSDTGWTMRFAVITASGAPRIDDTGTGGAPQLSFPLVELRFFNTSKGPFTPVVTFRASIGAIDLLTEVGGTTWGPSFSETNLTVTGLTRTQANVDAATMPVQTATDLTPPVKHGFAQANDNLITDFIALPPLVIGGLNITLCSCTRLTGDQRYTEYFNVA